MDEATPSPEPKPYEVSEQLSSLEGEARTWLEANQQPFEELSRSAPRFRLDLVGGELTLGDVLFDDLRARVLCSIGVEDPESHTFYPALRIDGYPDVLVAELRKGANKGPLIDLPELRTAELPSICPEMIWTFAAIVAKTMEGTAIHVVEADGARHYLVLGEQEKLNPDHSSMSDEQALARMGELAQPVASELALTFSPQMLERATNEEVAEGLDMALARVDMLVAEFKSCATHAQMIGSEAAPRFEAGAEDLQTRLDGIEASAKQREFEPAMRQISDLAIALEGYVGASSA